MRGGTAGDSPKPVVWQGLSPRARGNPIKRDGEDARVGTIPACAGEPSHLRNLRKNPRDYPRVRGGTRLQRRSTGPPAGLSPRARGNHDLSVDLLSIGGTIPACAGEPGLYGGQS